MIPRVMAHDFFWFLLVGLFSAALSSYRETNSVYYRNSNNTLTNSIDSNYTEPYSNDSISDINILADIFRRKMIEIKSIKETELIILVDGSTSIGPENFQYEMKYIQKVIADIIVSPAYTRLGVIIYSKSYKVLVDHLESNSLDHDKCSVLNYDLPRVNYTGGATNTRAAFIKSREMLQHSRPNAQRLIFHVTDGFSNGGDPIPIADGLKKKGVEIFSFGIVNGNVKELSRIASRPTYEHAYLFDSFSDFEAFARRALHEDLQPGFYEPVANSSLCDIICKDPGIEGCCNEESKCTCGVLTGHFSCLCPPGYYGTGLLDEPCEPCPNGTYSEGSIPGDVLACFPCPDRHQITLKVPAVSKDDCVCMDGYIPDGYRCKIITCPEITLPSNAYFVNGKCSNVLNAACGIRCHAGFSLSGSSVRICQKNGTWSGTPASCIPKECHEPKPVPHSVMMCEDQDDDFFVIINYNGNGTAMKNSIGGEIPEDRIVPTEKPKNNTGVNLKRDFNFPVGTDCNYTCAAGYFLIGSDSRSCLPMLKWSGLKPTCKAIMCRSLPKLEHGKVLPKNCSTKGIKHKFGEVCTYFCESGYELQGPKMTNCTGRHGSWSQKNNPSKCVDVEPPVFLNCPKNITVPTDEGVHYATVNWQLPNAIDNSGVEPMVWSKPPIDPDYPLRYIIGETEIQIYSVDDSGNYAFCSFYIIVQDREPPQVLECESPPTFFISQFPSDSYEIVWKEPTFDDNSGVPIPVTKIPNVSEFPLGVTTIKYVATDYAGNSATCVMNITILENPCHLRPEASNTIWMCSTNEEDISCTVYCEEGFAFATNTNTRSLDLTCTYSGSRAFWSPDIFQGDMDLFPECSEVEDPTEISEILIEGTEEICNSIGNNQSIINVNFGGELVPMIAVCEDDLNEDDYSEEDYSTPEIYDESDVTETTTEDVSYIAESSTEYDEITSKSEENDWSSSTTENYIYDIYDLYGNLRAETTTNNKTELSDSTTSERSVISESTEGEISSSEVSTTEDVTSGSSIKRDQTTESTDVATGSSTKLDMATESTEDVTSGSSTERDMTTEKTENVNIIRKKRNSNKRKKKLRIVSPLKEQKHGKEKSNNHLTEVKIKLEEVLKKYGQGETIEDIELKEFVRLKCKRGSVLRENLCIKCPRGTFHNLKRNICQPCPLGHYQEVEGQTSCRSCREGSSTIKIRRKSRKQCRRICPPGTFGRQRGKNPLSLGPCTSCPVGKFQPHKGKTFCESCLENYTTEKRGSTSKNQCVLKSQLEDLCFGKQCKNGGVCIVIDGYAICQCPPGYLGARCEKRFNPCASSPCYNGGECVFSTPINYECVCPQGYEGKDCEREVNECLSNPCGVHGQCIDLFDAYRCECFPGFTGDNCNERISLCEELKPCKNSGYCVDTPKSYSCICKEEFTGLNCEDSIFFNDTSLLTPVDWDFNPCREITCRGNRKCEIQWDRQPKCVCEDGFRGEDCTEKVKTNVILSFPRYGVTEYLSANFPEEDISEISVCFWLQTKDNFNFGTVFSYATPDDDNTFTFTDYSGLVLYVSGNHAVSDLAANDGLWHFICVTWQSFGGLWKIYLDGSVYSSGSDLSPGLFISGGGKFVVGQEQDLFGGGFNEVEGFFGRLTHFDVWRGILDELDVKDLYLNCDTKSGNLVSWKKLLQHAHGEIQEEESKFCTSCKKNLMVSNGHITYEHIGALTWANYECNEGFSVVLEENPTIPTTDLQIVKSYMRRCMKFGEWEGKEPKCARIPCGFPGYLANGKINGLSYLLGDVIKYECEAGYSMIGNATRECLINGTWSGKPPVCKGNSSNCAKLVAPRHGTMFVYLAQERPYGTSLPSVGDRVEFTCDTGYRLKGFSFLTCDSNGLWDRQTPTCEVITCQFPEEAQSYLSNTILRSSTFRYGDSLTIVCEDGTKRIISCGDFGTWNVTSQICGGKCFGKPPEPPYGFVVNDGKPIHKAGDSMTITCLPGFFLEGDSIATCSDDGTWKQSKFSICQPVNCGPPPRPPHPYDIDHVEGYSFNQRIFLKCRPGFRKTGEIFLKCNEKGKWSRIRNTCTPTVCGPPVLPQGYSTTEDERPVYEYQEVITLNCPVGQVLAPNSRSFMVCQEGGSWSSVPECISDL